MKSGFFSTPKLMNSSTFQTEKPPYYFFFYQGFLSHTLTIHRTAGEGRGPSFIPFYQSQPLTNIETFICNFACEMTTRLLHVRWLPRFTTSSNYHLSDCWWCNICLLTWWIDSRFLLQRFDMGNRWIWTRIDYHPCITSKPTNQVCCSSLITDISQNNHILPRPFQSAFKYHNMDR